MAKTCILTFKADKLLVGPLTLRVRVHNGRLVDTELTLAGRPWTPEQLLRHERAWYEAAMSAARDEVSA